MGGDYMDIITEMQLYTMQLYSKCFFRLET